MCRDNAKTCNRWMYHWQDSQCHSRSVWWNLRELADWRGWPCHLALVCRGKQLVDLAHGRPQNSSGNDWWILCQSVKAKDVGERVRVSRNGLEGPSTLGITHKCQAYVSQKYHLVVLIKFYSETEAPKAEPPSKRGDTFFRTVLRREGNITQDDALDNTKTLDKTRTHKFRVWS